jgi:MSHA pilin protein MshC
MPDQKWEKGFTLIEIISVLIVLSIVSLVMVSRITSTANVSIKVKAETLKGHIRYVLMRAMNDDADKSAISACSASFGISMSGSSYFMFRNCNKALKVILPGVNAADVPLTNMTLSPSTDVTFDKWGRPCSDLNGVTPYNADINLTLGGKEPIKITKNTGYVP